jgi:hypothetical protein
MLPRLARILEDTFAMLTNALRARGLVSKNAADFARTAAYTGYITALEWPIRRLGRSRV